MPEKKKNPDEVVHLQPKPGATVVYRDKAYGQGATLQLRRGDRSEVDGPVTEVDPAEVPDMGSLPPAA